ncbi:MAG: ArgE/DapE family deacylase [Thermomicrobiales bacterium]|nr:ArgE/DapE family deacylase [Thermomicrobiales bacterium]
MTDLEQLLSDLVAIDSVNPDLVPGGAGEEKIATFVAGYLTRAGLEVTLQTTAPGRPNVIGIVRGAGGGRSLMLNAHMDTVGLGGPDGGLTPRIEGNRLYGRGSFDMKGSLAAMMLAGAELAKNPPRGDVILTAVTDEEYASIGTQAIVAEYTADAAIITEPSGMETCIAHKGFVWAEIETFGEAAHGSRLNAGIDAITKMGRVLVGLEELDRKLRARPNHPLVETASLHASLIEGGIELSTYPDRCRLQLERRTVPGETGASVEAELREIVRRAGEHDSQFRAEIRIGIVRDPFEIGEDAEIVRTVRRVAKQVTKHDRIFSGTFGWMDSALLAAAGIPTVIYGPNGDGAHADAEWVDLDTVEQCRQVYLATAREFCG